MPVLKAKYNGQWVEVSGGVGGNSGGLLNPTTATVGEIMVVAEVDENGAPTKWKSVDINTLINALLPSVTEADNGKILMVVDGVWQAVALPNAEEANF